MKASSKILRYFKVVLIKIYKILLYVFFILREPFDNSPRTVIIFFYSFYCPSFKKKVNRKRKLIITINKDNTRKVKLK